MEQEQPVSDRSDADPAIDVLPDAYADQRRSTLGRIMDALEERLLLDRIGPARGLRFLDVGCGDGPNAKARRLPFSHASIRTSHRPSRRRA